MRNTATNQTHQSPKQTLSQAASAPQAPEVDELVLSLREFFARVEDAGIEAWVTDLDKHPHYLFTPGKLRDVQPWVAGSVCGTAIVLVVHDRGTAQDVGRRAYHEVAHLQRQLACWRRKLSSDPALYLPAPEVRYA